MRPDEELIQLQTQENLLLHILSVCHPVDVRITVYQIRKVRRQIVAMRSKQMVSKFGWVVVLVLLMALVVSPAYAQDGGEIVIQPEGLVYTIIGALAGALAGGAGIYYRLKGTRPAQDLDENSRNGMLGLLLVGGWLASLTPGQWDDQQLEKIMAANGFQKPAYPHPLTPSPQSKEGELKSASAWGLTPQKVRSAPPPTDTRGMWNESPPIGDFLPDDDEVVKG